MSIDRILQLKLLADVSDISKKTGQVESDVGKMRGAFEGLKSFVGPAMLSVGLQAGSALVDGIMGGFADSEAYDRAFGELEANLGKLPDALPADELAGKLDSISFDLGFDDAETLGAFNELLNRTGDVDAAMVALEASFDLAAARGVDLGAAAAEVGNIFKGEGEKLAEWGVINDEPVRNSIDNVVAALGHLDSEAEDRAAELEGVFDKIGVGADRGFAMAASALTDMAEDILPKLADLWDEFGPKVMEVAGKFGEMASKVVELGAAVTEKLEPVLKPLAEVVFAQIETTLNTLIGVFDTLILLLDGDLTGAWESLRTTMEDTFAGLLNIVKGPINALLWAIETGLNHLGSAFIRAIETIIRPFNSLAFVGDLIPDSPLVWPGITVPRLAAGGIVTSPTLAMIGEAGPEAVVPLGQGIGGVTVNVYATAVSPADVGREVVDAIEAYERRAGSGWRAA